MKLYFHCYAHINIPSVQFQLLIGIIFILLLYIFIATSYFRCKPIFLLHAHICIANSYFYCMHIFVLQAHIFIASAYFYCKRIFLLQSTYIFIVCAYFCCNLVEKFPTLCKKFLTLFKIFLTVWRYAKHGKQNRVIMKTRLHLMATCEGHTVLERTRKALNFSQLLLFSTGKELESLLFESSKNGSFK